MLPKQRPIKFWSVIHFLETSNIKLFSILFSLFYQFLQFLGNESLQKFGSIPQVLNLNRSSCFSPLLEDSHIPGQGGLNLLRMNRNHDDIGWYHHERPPVRMCGSAYMTCWVSSGFFARFSCGLCSPAFDLRLLMTCLPISSAVPTRLPLPHPLGVSLHICTYGPSLALPSLLSPLASAESLPQVWGPVAALWRIPGSDLPASCALPLPRGWPTRASITFSNIRIHDSRSTWSYLAGSF